MAVSLSVGLSRLRGFAVWFFWSVLLGWFRVWCLLSCLLCLGAGFLVLLACCSWSFPGLVAAVSPVGGLGLSGALVAGFWVGSGVCGFCPVLVWFVWSCFGFSSSPWLLCVLLLVFPFVVALSRSVALCFPLFNQFWSLLKTIWHWHRLSRQQRFVTEPSNSFANQLVSAQSILLLPNSWTTGGAKSVVKKATDVLGSVSRAASLPPPTNSEM